MILLKWSHKCNIGGIKYQTGFEQSVYLDGSFDYPNVTAEETVKTDINGNSILKTYNQSQRCAFTVCEIPDVWLPVFTLIRAHSNITMCDTETGEITTLKDFNFTSAPDGGKCFSTGVFSFLAERFNPSGCCEEGQLIKLNA